MFRVIWYCCNPVSLSHYDTYCSCSWTEVTIVCTVVSAAVSALAHSQSASINAGVGSSLSRSTTEFLCIDSVEAYGSWRDLSKFHCELCGSQWRWIQFPHRTVILLSGRRDMSLICFVSIKLTSCCSNSSWFTVVWISLSYTLLPAARLRTLCLGLILLFLRVCVYVCVWLLDLFLLLVFGWGFIFGCFFDCFCVGFFFLFVWVGFSSFFVCLCVCVCVCVCVCLGQLPEDQSHTWLKSLPPSSPLYSSYTGVLYVTLAVISLHWVYCTALSLVLRKLWLSSGHVSSKLAGVIGSMSFPVVLCVVSIGYSFRLWWSLSALACGSQVM